MPTEMRVLAGADFGSLIHLLEEAGYTVIGPTITAGAISYGELHSHRDLPVGVGDLQAPASYRLTDRTDGAYFGYVVGPHSWKRFLHPPEEVVWRGRMTPEGVRSEPPVPPAQLAFIGVRPCELAAIAIQRTVFEKGGDPRYSERLASSLLVAVNCTAPGGNCFCASMNTGPFADSGFDLLLTEVTGAEHHFLVESGSERGAEILAQLPAVEAHDDGTLERMREAAIAAMPKELETEGLAGFLAANLEHPNWDTVARRCLSCANCTLVCPTCFCSSFDDELALDGVTATRTRRWDSCFALEFSYIHGGAVRKETYSRYRQWMTHKLSSWYDQFGSSGCVGCGRCITWCPAGIDITAEAAVMRRSEHAVG